ncbi:hypothetical protein [Allohahella sp. A8]|uniref:hypothetical protein n=1 Tax=Allohahella sp. A8 TaxID=3141461 RepID=UPI003A7FDA16
MSSKQEVQQKAYVDGMVGACWEAINPLLQNHEELNRKHDELTQQHQQLMHEMKEAQKAYERVRRDSRELAEEVADDMRNRLRDIQSSLSNYEVRNMKQQFYSLRALVHEVAAAKSQISIHVDQMPLIFMALAFGLQFAALLVWGWS